MKESAGHSLSCKKKNEHISDASIQTQKKHQGIIVGILGDSSVEKDFFAKEFALCFRRVMPCYFQTCTYTCHTIPSMSNHIRLRDFFKKTALELRLLHSSQDLTIVTIPCELVFSSRGETDAINSARIEFLGTFDAFIIFDSHCSPGLKDKKEDALCRYHLDKRIVAKINATKPLGKFSICSSVQQNDECFFFNATGMNRKRSSEMVAATMLQQLRDLVQYISYIPVVRRAQAACALTFLTDIGGTCYGAAVRSCLTGKIYSSGQYSSFNHTTNIHAEMQVLSQAAAAGDPDIDVLAIACSKKEKAFSCGVCRQVMKEHAERTGRDFNVIFVTSDVHFKVMQISELLPNSWSTKATNTNKNLRIFHPSKDLFTDTTCEIGSACFEQNINGKANFISMVWDPYFASDLLLKKIKYMGTNNKDCWEKVPHAFTEAERYQRYLIDHHLNSKEFPHFFVDDNKIKKFYRNPRLLNHMDIPEKKLEKLNHEIFYPAELDVFKNVYLFGSRLLGMHTPTSDYDLIIRANPEQIKKLRGTVANKILAGILQSPKTSGSIKYLSKVYPTAETLIKERRYCDTFSFEGSSFSFLFASAEEQKEVSLPSNLVSVGHRSFWGRILDASYAPYKRSESILENFNGERIRILCYHKIGTMLLEQDLVAVSGTYFEPVKGAINNTLPTLLLGNAFTDKIVWMK